MPVKHSSRESFSLDAGMWGPNVPSHYEATFDELYFEFSGSPTAHFGVDVDLGLAWGGIGLDVTLNYLLGFGMIAKVVLDTGEVNVDYEFETNAVKSQLMDTINQKSWIDTSGYDVTRASVWTDGINLQDTGVFVDLVAKFAASIDVSLSAYAGIDLLVETLETDASVDFTIPLGSFEAVKRLVDLSFGDGEKSFDSDYGSLEFALPTNTDQGSNTLIADSHDGLDNVHTSNVSDPFATASVDFVAIAAALAGIPSELFSGEFEADAMGFYLDVDYTVFSEVLSEHASLKQEFTFDADRVDVTMISQFGPTDKISGYSQTLTGQLGDKFDFTTPEGEGTFTVKAYYDLHGTLTASHYVQLTTSYVVTLLEASIEAGIDFADIIDLSLGPIEIGPLLELGLEGLPIDIPLFEISTQYDLGTTMETYTIGWEKFYTGTDGANTLTLTTHQETINALAGNDRITGNALNNTITGDSGNDSLWGKDGDDTLDGGIGSDMLDGGSGRDLLIGGTSEDTLIGGSGRDTLDGGASSDTASYAGAGGSVVVDMAKTSNNTGDAYGDVFLSIENVFGTAYGDTLMGDKFANKLWGDAGNDVLNGRDGADTIDGGAGNDAITGGAGADILTGGAGADTFYFMGKTEGGDRITDFGADDFIAISKSGFASSTLTFVSGTAATSSAASLVFNTASKQLLWDADGTGSAAPMLLATITGVNVTAADVLLV